MIIYVGKERRSYSIIVSLMPIVYNVTPTNICIYTQRSP